MPPNLPGESTRHDKESWGGRDGQRRWNYRRPRDTRPTYIRSNPWQSASAMELGLRPRSFEELHTERSYLLEMLQQQDRQALELYRRLPHVEEQIERCNDPDGVKRAKKHQGWLKNRVAETVKEEKGILTRLSELYVEIQCRDRWYQVERDREARRMQQHYPLPGYGTLPPAMPAPPLQLYTPQPLVLCPCGWYGVHYHDNSTAYYGPRPGSYQTPSQPPAQNNTTINPQGHDGAEGERTSSRGGESNGTARKHSVAVEGTSDSKPKERRMSLP
ncbi:hypothetical protein F4779DRAFT_612567 [Xylariaceae sp. FL0662B]|nr:hypothetical protein F4779DRAFT_612567 [Xylariaceae sp. FL0662B]